MSMSLYVKSTFSSPSENNVHKLLPFYNLVDYDIELLFESTKQRIKKLMTDHRLSDFIKEKALSDILNIH